MKLNDLCKNLRKEIVEEENRMENELRELQLEFEAKKSFVNETNSLCKNEIAKVFEQKLRELEQISCNANDRESLLESLHLLHSRKNDSELTRLEIKQNVKDKMVEGPTIL